MFIYGLSEKEISILDGWSISVGLTIPEHIGKLRRAWINSGGKLPVTEAQALFLKPRSETA